MGVVPSMTLARIDAVTARTTLRLWHELYVEKKLPHDFQDVFDPRFGVGVEARAEVGRVGFLEGRRGEVRVVGRVLGGVDAWLRSEQGV